MEIEINVRKLKLHFAFALGVALLGSAYYAWRTYRWDQPWLAPLRGYDMIAVRFDGLSYKDPEFAKLRTAFWQPFTKTDPGSPNLHGFRPSDFSSDEQTLLGRYAWVQMIGYVESSQRIGALEKIRDDVALEIRKTGLSIRWRMALITREGSVIYAD